MPSKSVIGDIDIFGREHADGTAFEIYDDQAIGNALTLWMVSKKGDFLMNPDIGGVLDKANFKNMTSEFLDLLQFDLETELYLVFDEFVTVNGIYLEPDYENNMLIITVTYESKLTFEQKETTIYIDSKQNIEKFVYEVVNLEGQNLEDFVLMKLSSMDGRKTKYNFDEESFVWGRYKLVNLTPTDEPWFSRIFSLINA